MGRRGIWSYVDLRDAARAYRLACEVEDVEYEAIFIVADDVLAISPVAQLLHRQLPDVPVRPPLPEVGPIISSMRAKEVLGYKPRHRWRDQLACGPEVPVVDRDS